MRLRFTLLMTIITVFLVTNVTFAQDATPEATPEAATILTLPPAMEALVGVWDTEAPSGDSTVPAQMIFFPNVAVFELSQTDKKNYIALGKYEIVDDTHLDATILGLDTAGSALGGVPAQIEITALTDDSATLIITLSSTKSETQLALKRAADQEDNSAQLLGVWKSVDTEGSNEFLADNTVNLELNSQTGDTHSLGVLTYFLHGDRLDFLVVLELTTKLGDSEVTITTFNPALSADVVFTDEDSLELHDPQTGDVLNKLERVQS